MRIICTIKIIKKGLLFVQFVHTLGSEACDNELLLLIFAAFWVFFFCLF